MKAPRRRECGQEDGGTRKRGEIQLIPARRPQQGCSHGGEQNDFEMSDERNVECERKSEREAGESSKHENCGRFQPGRTNPFGV